MKLGDCIHFNGIQNKLCEAGVDYHDLATPRYNLPCLTGFLAETNKTPDCRCSKYQAATEEDVAKDRAEMLAAVAALNDETCPQCRATLQVRQVGGSKAMFCATHGLVAQFCNVSEVT